MSELKLMVGDWVLRNGIKVKVTPNLLLSLDVSPAFSGTIKPITLTPDVLERIGFVNKSNDWTLDITFEFKVMIYNESNYNGFMAYTRTIHTDWTPVYSMTHFKHLHTLQQLIRLFTGKEIEVKW